MNPETNENNNMDANEQATDVVDNYESQRKRKALDTLNDNVNQSRLQYAPDTGNIQAQQQLASTSYDNNGHCQACGHRNTTMEAMNAAMDAHYLDNLPIGYRFEPTDRELVRHYLLRKIRNESLPKNKISVATIYGNHPKDIVGFYPQAKEGEWYFFTSRKRKYTNGKRPDRKAGVGYWKATGPDKVINYKGVKIGGKKSLVYYEGHPPNGTKTNWMMHEYVVEGYERIRASKEDMLLDEHVLCKIYNKHGRGKELKEEDDSDENPGDVLNENPTTNLPVENGVVEAHQQAPETNPANFQVENNVEVQHFNQGANHTINQVEHNLPNLYSDQPVNPSFENGDKGVQRQLVVPDQRARAHLDAHPTNFQVTNNMPVQHPSRASHHVENNMMDTNQHMHPGVENRVKEVNRHIMVRDHQHMRTVSNQVQYSNQNENRATHHAVNNFPTFNSHQQVNPNIGNGRENIQRQVRVPDQQRRLITHLDGGNPIIFNHVANYSSIVYNHQNMGLPYGHVQANMIPPRPVQMINSPRMKSPLVNHSRPTGINPYSQLQSNRSPNVPPSWTPHPPPAHNVHVKQEMSGFVAPAQLQAAPTACQESNDSDEPADINTHIESMFNKDDFHYVLNLGSDENFQFDADESGKLEAPKDEGEKNY